MRALSLLTLCLTAAIAGTWIVLCADLLTIVARGGAGSLGFVCAAAAAIGIPVGAVMAAFATGFDALERRRGWPGGRLFAGLCALAFAAGMFPTHKAFVRHILGAWLSTIYAVAAAWLVASVGRRLWHADGPRAGIALVAASGVSVAVMHWVNTHLFVGLYPPLHRALTGMSVAMAMLGVAVLLRRRPRVRAALLAASLLAALVGGLTYDPQPTRTGIYFHGTATGHVFDGLARLLDGDGDGVPRPGGGADCDDADPTVHPLRYEIPGNGKDDNCRLGDATGTAPPRTAPPVAALAGWRAAHPDVSVLVLFIDTLRADHVTAEGTPTLWQLAERGVTFEQARTTVPRTPHAWSSLLTARFPSRLLACRAHLRPLPDATLISHARAAGLQTLGRLVGKDFERRHLINDFDRVNTNGHPGRPSGHAVTDDLLALFDATPGRVFAVGHYADPHAPYRPPEAFRRGTTLRARYADEVRYADHQIERLLAGLRARGRLQNTVIVALSDHGENLGDHGDAGGHHGVSVYDEVLHVPLIVTGPGIAPGRVVDPVSLVDVAPTLLALIGAAPLPAPDGRSLAGYLLGEPPPPVHTISEFYDFGHRLRAIVHGRHKLIDDLRHGVRQVFDLSADPGELVDLGADAPAAAETLQGLLDGWVEHVADPDEPDPTLCKGL